MEQNRRDFIRSAALLGAAAVAGRSSAQPKPAPKAAAAIRIAHCGDPQFGFGQKGGKNAYKYDLARFERLIESVNRERPDLVFLAGDMTHVAHDVTRDWPRLLTLFKSPVLATPGNHDLGIPLLGRRLARYRGVFGYDYKSMKVGKWRFISGNTMYWHKTEEVEEKRKYEEWLAAELAKAKAAHEPVILCGHIPPFVSNAGEKDGYENYPKAGRAARLKMYLDHGVHYFLSGHTHRLIVRAHKGMTILNPETTSRNFDQLPYGYRMMTLRDDGYGWDFIRV